MGKPIIRASGVASFQSIYDSSSDPEHKVGTAAFLDDGRSFYYAAAASTALNVGQLYRAADIVGNHQNLATTTTALVAGSSEVTGVTLGATAATANQYRDGYLAVTDGGGEGYLYRIRDHAAIASAGTGGFTLYDNVKVASDANTTVSLFKNLYDSPVITAVDQQDVLVGVPAATIAANEYGWIQTWGPCPVLCDEAIATVGQAVVTGTGVTGAAEEDDTATTVSQEPLVGYNLSAFVDTEYQLVDLRIRP